MVQTEDWIARPPDSAASEMISDLVRLKLLAGFQREVDPHEALDVVRHYAVQLGIVPQETFELLGIRQIFRRLYRQESPLYFQFDRELWVASPNVYRCFFEQYVWDGEGPYERDMQRVRHSGP